MVEAISTKRTLDLFKGWNFPPILVGIVRGLAEAAVLAALGVLAVNTDTIVNALPQSWDDTLSELGVSQVMLGSAMYWAIRSIEAYADQKIDPQQNRLAEERAANPPQ